MPPVAPSAKRGITRAVRRLTTCLLIAGFGIAFGVAGCGGDDSDAGGFSEDYNAAIERLGRVNEDLADLRNSRSTRAIAHEFEEFAAALQSTRADLSRLEPPADAADEFDAVLAALEDGVRTSRRAAHAARAIRPAGQRRAVRDLQRAAEELAAAEDALRQAVAGGEG
jgi:hypothetical protein